MPEGYLEMPKVIEQMGFFNLFKLINLRKSIKPSFRNDLLGLTCKNFFPIPSEIAMGFPEIELSFLFEYLHSKCSK